MKLFNNITLAIAALFLVVANSTAQTGTQLRSLQWQAPAKANIAEGWPADYLVFNGSVNAPEYGKVPVYAETIKLTGGNNDFNITISNVVTEPLSPAEKAVLTPLPQLPAKVVAEKSVGYANGVPRGAFRFPGVLFNATQNRYEKVVSFEYTVTPFTASKPKSTANFATNSVLSSGRWYKFAIVNDGVYKIDRAFLTSLGMNGTVNPANIRIYGNGGGALPAVNSTPRIDDLEEIAIEVNGGNDGSFDASDYLLFYGKGQLRWNYNSTAGIFNHVVNQYSDTTYYFITTDLGPGKRINGQASANDATPTYTANTFNDYALHNKDEVNLIRSGSRWFGEKFDIINDYTFSFNFPNLSTTDLVKVRTAIAANLNVNGNAIFSVKSGSNNLGSVSVADVFGNPYQAANVGTATLDLSTTSTSIPITVTKLTNGCEGWLDFIELNVKRNLSLVGNQTAFRAIQGVGIGQITKYNVGNAQNARVWDVTDHQNVALQQISLNGSEATFTLPSDILREFIVHSGSSFAAPIPVGSVNNQNLHATAPVDLIIVSAPEFLAYANQVADIHRTYDNMDVIVTTPQAIYNEFSSGAADIVAIRSFARMLYKRANTVDEQPRYLLLFGDGSYDNKYRTPDNTNFVPTFQSDESLAIVGSYTADDYMGLLDDNEGGYGSNEPIDIGIGRIPCQNAGEAQVVVTKINDYINVAGQRDWRNMISFFADDQDYNAHQKQALILGDSLDIKYRPFNLEKVMFDAYVQESNAGGQRYPEVKDILNKRVNRGGLIVNYTGHGGEAGWSAEKVLEISDIDSWTNKYELPAFVTATCEFSKYDDPARKTAGEMVLVNDNGGICLFTTTRLVYSSPNFILNRNFYENFISGIKLGEQPRMGDLYKQTKVDQANDGNARNFTLLGDPALRLNYPIHDVVTTEINGNPVTETSIDTIKALQLVTVKGYVKSRTGTGVLSNYNGTIYPTIYDKPITIETLGQDADSPQMTFKTQRNIIYKGKASVVNGYWTFTFPVPKDISYQYGFGKISYYVENGVRDQDGHGVKELVIGGSDTANFCDNIGPAISLYMNDTKFANGGTTDENPTLLAMLADTNGINTVGTGIGHDLVAILDNNTNEPYVLNDYYEANLNSYSRGTVRYPFTNLKDGPHTLRVKAWDVCNNSNETTLDFVVARTAGLALEHVLNYPNPFTTNTCFMFEHNRPNQSLNVQVQVFTVSGKIVKTINTTLSSNGYRADCINWNGLDDFGDKIGRGVYIYRLKITDETGNKADKYEKLVILN
jgi:Peptidase family C25